jgi:hypothetical protein
VTARTNTSIRLSADERRRLLAWGPDLASAVRKVLDVADAAKVWRGGGHAASLVLAVDKAPVAQPTLRDRVREKMQPGRSAGDIAWLLGVSRQSVEYHARKIREGA